MRSEGAELDVRNSERKGWRLNSGLEKGRGQLPSFHRGPLPTAASTQNYSPKLFWLSEEGAHPFSSPQLWIWAETGGQEEQPLAWTDPEGDVKRRTIHGHFEQL